MRRNIEQWRGCDPKAMTAQSEAAVMYALDDARADILALHEALSEIALAGMSAPTPMHEAEIRAWHARRAFEFIAIAARAMTPNDSFRATSAEGAKVAPGSASCAGGETP